MTQQERHRIAAGLTGGLAYAEIARRLGRPTSTISREVTRNGGPGGYRPQHAHEVTTQRARRSTPPPPRAGAADRPAPDALDEGIVELAVRSGMPRTTARVHIDLLMSEDGRRTAAELTRRLRLSAASVSVAVNFLVRNGYARRERDPQRRRDVYVIDDDAWYHSILISSRQTLEVAQAAITAAETLAPDSPAAQRLTRAGTFLRQVVQDTMESADRWRPLLS
ncbi:helix-turn-helix domain-containing protein [Streptomyces sp. NPDC092046]|uniref:GbsR/MarR family transcriptional regulator n=1 Tax=Streptomyces sp. NPDC092046 TaxID=3366009 RepID=UPI0037F76618